MPESVARNAGLTHEEMRELEADKGQISLELEPCQAPYPDAFDRKSISDFVARTRMTEEWDEEHTTESVLELLHLGKLGQGTFCPKQRMLFALCE